jgi:lipopolysaccharide biosynthesis glycosyltransferase
MLHSLGANLAPGRTADVYILSDGLSPALQARVQSSVTPNLTLHWRPALPLDPLLPIWGRISSTTYQRLLLTDWLPAHLPRVLWLDCDMLILGDAAELWDAPFPSPAIALAVTDERIPLVSSRFGVAAWRELGLPANAPHFNAGLLLIDLPAWTAHDVPGRSIDYLRRYRDRVYFMDQEALNAILCGHWQPLPHRWNCHPSLAPPHDPPAILHFTGNLKPWHFAGSTPPRRLYATYRQRTAWANDPLPRSWRDAVLERYEDSRFRRLLIPLEQAAMVLRRSLSRQ